MANAFGGRKFTDKTHGGQNITGADQTTTAKQSTDDTMRLQQQQNKFGCGLACVAMIAGTPYREIREVFRELNGDPEFMFVPRPNHNMVVKNYGTNVTNLQQILDLYNIRANKSETKFTGWDNLPDVAILAVNFRKELVGGEKKECWHWVVWNRELDCVLDPFPYATDIYQAKKAKRRSRNLPSNIRTDYKRMRPISYIRVYT